jgi:hypothetical protein
LPSNVGSFFFGCCRNFALVHAAILVYIWKYPWAPAPLACTTRSGPVEMCQLFDQVNILKEYPAPLPGCEGVLVVSDRDSLVCRKSFLRNDFHKANIAV